MGKKRKTKKDEQTNLQDDERFAAGRNRPQFSQRPRKKHGEKIVDDRFASAQTDPRFQLEEKDKYGRKRRAGKTKKAKEEDKTVPSDNNDASNEEISIESDTEKVEDPASRIAYLTALSRGELDVSSSSDEEDEEGSSSSSSDEDGSEYEEEDPVYGVAGVLDPSNKEEEIEITDESSPYLAVMDMEWAHVRAVDLFVIFSSFAPTGTLKRVRVFPSDFGLERMAKEDIQGPTGIWKRKRIAEGGPEPSLDINPAEDGRESEDESEESSKDDSVESGGGVLVDEDEIKVIQHEQSVIEPDFDREKLRAYEASKLKYYFAIVEFASPEHADVAYKELDGMEFEHSSAAIDLRTVPPSELEAAVKGREVRDEATSIPSNYLPPEFVVAALQQTNVECTWDMADKDRERTLTKFGTGQAASWHALAESDDLKAYIASDVSSDESDDGDDEGEKQSKTSMMRKMLGLESDNEDERGSISEGSSEEDGQEVDGEYSKEVSFIPGKSNLEEKVRSKLKAKNEHAELTPWQKYQEKRKQKRKERRQKARSKRSDNLVENISSEKNDDSSEVEHEETDDFFLGEHDTKENTLGEKPKVRGESIQAQHKGGNSKHELELLLAGDDAEENARDFDMRGLQRIEKNKDKKFRGSRKRKEAQIASTVTGADFEVNVHDDRFAAVLEGTDDRFGIDRTDPNYKETPAMQAILAEQTRRRKKKRRKKAESAPVVPDVNADSEPNNSGSAALSSLVKSLKAKVSS